ncbi:MAG TPA: hypothetical protein VMG35_26475 [Bryobacteraceae bacterium]|nr:hypothetical protein [Bryobacteraceae bacterium]
MAATRVSLTWSPAVPGTLSIANYHVYRGSSPANLTQFAITTNVYCTDTTTSPGATYYYSVAAADTQGNLSPMSAVATATTPMPPSAPTGLTASPLSTTIISLTWNAAASGGLPVSYYQVFRGASPSTLAQIGTVIQPYYTDTSAVAGTAYYYAVEAQDSGRDVSAMSGVVQITAPMPPSAPTGIAAAATSATIASVTWGASASGGLPISYYLVFRGSSPSTLSQIGIVAQPYYTDTSVTPGATYYYAVEGEDSGRDFSSISATTTVTLYNLPGAPTGLAATPASNVPPGASQASYSVSLTWNPAVSGGLPIQFYQVFRGTSPAGLSQIGAVGGTSYTDNTVNPATAYYYAVVAVDAGSDPSVMSDSVTATTGGGQTTGLFNILPMSINSFTPTPFNLPGLPTVDTAAGPMPSVGYQGGFVVNGQAIYFPWQVQAGGTSWVNDIQNGIPQSVILSYNTNGGLAGFNNPANWNYFDLSTLAWYSQGGIQGNNALPNLPAGFQGGAVSGNMVYPAPKGGHPGPNGGAGPYPVFIQYDSSKALNDPTAYQTFVPPPMGTTMGYTYGWCSAVFDGRFVYYVPLSNSVTGYSGNIFRYDTTQPFSNLTTGGVTSAWSNFDMYLGPGSPNGIDSNAEGFQAAVYDGYRYIYYIPFNASLIVRYDTWNGGAGPDPTGFTFASNYVTFDPTQLGTAGYPTVAGQGNTANLQGFTGATVAWDAAGENEYLYLVPWATFPGNAQNPILQSTVARVRIGAMTGSAWNPVDITSTATSPASSTPNWEMYDLSLLMQNPAWPTAWPVIQNNPALGTQNSITGYQAAYTSNSNSSGATFPPRVTFVPDTSQFLVEHDVGHDLFDPTGWYVTEIPQAYSFGTMGGGYDAVSAILYPASPNAPLYAFQF